MTLNFSFPDEKTVHVYFNGVTPETPRSDLYPLVASAIKWFKDWLVGQPLMKGVLDSSEIVEGNKFEVRFVLAPRTPRS